MRSKQATRSWAMGSFGGTYESAQSDERKEFKKMLAFIRKCKEKVSFIIVYSVDRFSRTGASGMYIASELRKEGIIVQALTQPTDPSTPGGKFQQNMYFLFSEYDNDLRREKCMAGTREKLMQGHWVTKPPMGYDIVRSDGEKRIVVNEKGKLLRKAFLWKAKD